MTNLFKTLRRLPNFDWDNLYKLHVYSKYKKGKCWIHSIIWLRICSWIYVYILITKVNIMYIHVYTLRITTSANYSNITANFLKNWKKNYKFTTLFGIDELLFWIESGEITSLKVLEEFKFWIFFIFKITISSFTKKLSVQH